MVSTAKAFGDMKNSSLYFLSWLLLIIVPLAESLPIKFDDQSLQEQGVGRSLSHQEEGRVFHAHALRKRKKKKLLHCLLSLQRNNPNSQADARFLVFNYMNIEYNQQGGNGAYHDDPNTNGNTNNCLSQFTGNGGGDNDSGGSGLEGIGEGINNLSSFVGQVPSNLITSVGDGIKPVFENPERYLNRYIIRPLYRSLRPLYRWF